MTKETPSSTPFLRLFLLACAALLVHGYHLGVDDAAIYIPAVKHIFNPALYPFGREFFLSHGRLSIFSFLVGAPARVLHLPINTAIFAWHILGIFLLLVACWRFATLCFTSAAACWSAVLLIAGTLAVPVAGTALVLVDPYVTARSLSTPATILAITSFLENRRLQAVAWLLLTALVHPQMAVYGVGFLGLLSLPLPWFTAAAATAPALAGFSGSLPGGFHLQPADGIYRQALYMRTFFFLWQWTWYEWIGVIAPLAILAGLARFSPRNSLPAFQRSVRALLPLGLMATLAGIVLSSSPRFENFVRLQPMRSFHLLYVLFFVLLGGLLGEYVLRERAWRWLAVFVPLGSGMLALALTSYPHSAHIEWPGVVDRNPWLQAFDWVRHNTPQDAVFALDPRYMAIPEEDQHGFRAIAERSMLSDYVKDSGVVSLFPGLAPEWNREQQAQAGWNQFKLADFQRLARAFPVTWVVVEQPAVSGLDCPYSNRSVAVCRIPSASASPSAAAISQAAAPAPAAPAPAAPSL